MMNQTTLNVASDKKASQPLAANVKATKILKKDYVLNDIEALKKKLDNSTRNPSIEISKEAVDGSCVTVGVKTALYEYFKARLMDDFKNHPNICEAKPIQKVVANTHMHGIADVEYQLEVSFKIGNNVHQVKVVCFSTTCNIMIQNMNGKSEQKTYLQNKHSARFFDEHFLIDFGKKAPEKFPNMDDQFIPKLRLELKKMQ